MTDPFVFPEWFEKESFSNDSTKELADFCRDILVESSTAEEMIENFHLTIPPFALPICDTKMVFILYRLMRHKGVAVPLPQEEENELQINA